MDTTTSGVRNTAAANRLATDNILLRSLSTSDQALLAPELERVPFTVGDLLARAGEPIAAFAFPKARLPACWTRWATSTGSRSA